MVIFVIGLTLLIVVSFIIKFTKDTIGDNTNVKRLLIGLFFIGVVLWITGMFLVFNPSNVIQ